MQILAPNLVLVHNSCIPTHTSVLADGSSLSTLRYLLLVASIWDASRNPLLANRSSPLFSCTSLLAACWLVIAALLVTPPRLIVHLASRSSTYAAAGILLLTACYNLPSRQWLSLKILVTRRSLDDVCSTLLPLCYWQLATHCYLFVVFSPFTYCLTLASHFLDPFFLVARPSPLTARLLNAYYMPIAITSWQLTTHHSLFLFSIRPWQNVVPSS